MNSTPSLNELNANLDPLSGSPGAHPMGTGVGAALGGAAAGVVLGSTVGPVGTLIGAAVGAVVGGLAGKGVAEMVDPTFEEDYWREQFSSRSYAPESSTFEQYQPAYRLGIDSFGRWRERSFDDVEPEMAGAWEHARGASPLAWQEAKHASRDAWERLTGQTAARSDRGAQPK